MKEAVFPWQTELYGRLLALRRHLPNGLIVAGPRGLGTFELVHRFAKDLLCENPRPDGSACGVCAGCRLAQAGNHPDLRYVLSESEALARGLPYEPPSGGATRRKPSEDILIHEPLSLENFLTLSSHRGEHRVVLVYPADRIRADAASVFLKMLEEPPQDLIFLLVAEDLDAILPTIRSRCLIFRALPPMRATAIRWLKEQGLTAPETALAEAGGMPLLALALARLDEKPREELASLLGSVLEGSDWVGRVIAAVPKDANQAEAVWFLQRWGWDLLAVKQGLAPRYFPRQNKVLQVLAASADAEKLFRWIHELNRLREAAGHPLNAKLSTERILLLYQGIFARR
ncbi:DNA polymerase III subunit delta [Mesosutterella sp. OilRF-GAM-744-9]|uniref:DNA polymerase III subunit delta n=1 Tax=Mesosutterella porci TaxID=2915351 RepID=A0ABS9MRV9_9BURK|nr:DNA polymerase III subunit delta [Mesosutterella sp. oilRF-744-WT-GAM-9]MCG5031361.1 DNA polymerase III subunit delta [Mesosutterella sp. oilRF-744-WT-GAM-9]